MDRGEKCRRGGVGLGTHAQSQGRLGGSGGQAADSISA